MKFDCRHIYLLEKLHGVGRPFMDTTMLTSHGETLATVWNAINSSIKSITAVTSKVKMKWKVSIAVLNLDLFILRISFYAFTALRIITITYGCDEFINAMADQRDSFIIQCRQLHWLFIEFMIYVYLIDCTVITVNTKM